MDQLLIHISCQKLSSQTLDVWERHRSAGDEPIPKLSEFHKFLITKDVTSVVKHREKGVDFRREFVNNRFIPISRPNHFNQNRSWNQGNDSSSKIVSELGRTKCYMRSCRDSHPLFMCAEFKRLNLLAKIQVLTKNQLCRCCLLPGHHISKCNKEQYRCKRSGDSEDKHHFSLCPHTMGLRGFKYLTA